MIVWVYDRWGNQKNCLYDLIEFSYTDEIGKVETVEFTIIGSDLEKGDYLVWRDDFLNWHEDIVASCEVKHQGITLQHVYAEDSITELALSYKGERDSYNFPNTIALQRLIEDTRWDYGTVSNLGTGDIKFYHETVYQGLVDLTDKFGGEIETSKTVSYAGVTGRRINWLSKRGSDNGLIFTYGFDTDNIERHVELDNIYTRVHVFGKGEPTYDDSGEQTGNGRRIDFSSINGGRDYVEDNDAMTRWGVLNKNGVKVHSEGVVIFEDCEDKNELLALGKMYLKEVSEPRVSYTANVAVLADAGMDFKNVRAGDTVYIRDEVLDERLQGRVMKVTRYLTGSKPTEVTLGNIVRNAATLFDYEQNQLKSLLARSASWDSAAYSNAEWLKNVMDTLNDEINATGGFVYWEYGEGITVYDKPVDQNPTMAIQLKGGSFRIANAKKSNGDWDWTTFGTGNGFTANLINVGTLMCGTNRIDLDSGTITLDNGVIQDKNGKNYWNLGTGEFRLSTDASYLNGTLGDYFKSIKNEIADVDKSMDSLDSELRKAMSDGIITEAESAAISKMLQRVQAEQAEAIKAYTDIYGNSLLTGTSKTTLYNTKVYLYGSNNTSGAYGTLVTRINAVINCKTASALTAAMKNYNSAYSTYQTYRTSFNAALTAAQTTIANAYAKVAADDAVDAQTQKSIFNKLTNNGTTQGIYLSGGKLYLNATYMEIGIISDKKGYNSWNLTTGALKTKNMTADSMVATNASVKGTFECGSTYGIKLNNTGQMAGFRNGSQVGYIDYSASSRDVDTGILYYGLQMQAKGIIRISSPKIAVAASSNINTMATYGITRSSRPYLSTFSSTNGNMRWTISYANFTNGFCTSFGE